MFTAGASAPVEFLQVPQSTLVLEPQCHNCTRSLIRCLEYGASMSGRNLLTACLSAGFSAPPGSQQPAETVAEALLHWERYTLVPLLLFLLGFQYINTIFIH